MSMSKDVREIDERIIVANVVNNFPFFTHFASYLCSMRYDDDKRKRWKKEVSVKKIQELFLNITRTFKILLSECKNSLEYP